jgi:hypothetical protein
MTTVRPMSTWASRVRRDAGGRQSCRPRIRSGVPSGRGASAATCSAGGRGDIADASQSGEAKGEPGTRNCAPASPRQTRACHRSARVEPWARAHLGPSLLGGTITTNGRRLAQTQAHAHATATSQATRTRQRPCARATLRAAAGKSIHVTGDRTELPVPLQITHAPTRGGRGAALREWIWRVVLSAAE